MSRHRVVSMCAVGLAAATAAMTLRASQLDMQSGVVVRGRIVDPDGLRTPTTTLMASYQVRFHSSASVPVPIDADGTFATPPLPPGTYVFEAVRTVNVSSPADLIGLDIVGVPAAKEPTVTLRRPTTLTAQYRMEGVDPNAAWPKDMQVIAEIALDGQAIMTHGVTEGAPGGRFVIRNAFGPRILKFGYRVESGPMWYPSKVLLDGRDITNVPTDFSEHPTGQLEVVFTQRPARIVGQVMDADGRPVPQAWVAAIGTDAAAAQPWSTTAHAVRANDRGQYSIVMPPGGYRVHALPAGAFETYETARPALSRIAFGGVTAIAKDRTFVRVDVTVQPR